MDNVMFRYILKYVGTYRVLPILLEGENDLPKDPAGGVDRSFDDFYIPCVKGIIKHTYQPYYMMWYTDKLTTGRNVKKELEDKSIPIYNYEETSSEVMLWFKDENMKEVASVVKPKTQGKNISPLSVKNTQQKTVIEKYSIPLKDYQQYAAIVEKLDFANKMQFARTATKDFDKVLVTIKGKKFDPVKARKASGYGYKEFVHSIGLWKEFINNTQKLYNSIYRGK